MIFDLSTMSIAASSTARLYTQDLRRAARSFDCDRTHRMESQESDLEVCDG